MAILRDILAPARVITHQTLGLNGDAKEAIAFAALAYGAIHGRPRNLPSCTGASKQRPLGKITPGENFEAILAAITPPAW